MPTICRRTSRCRLTPLIIFCGQNGEDFVYTQQIQKYYNPTIVSTTLSCLPMCSTPYGNAGYQINDNECRVRTFTHTHGLIIHTAMDGPIIPAGDGVLHGEDGAETSVSDIMTRGMRGLGPSWVGPEGGVQAGARLTWGLPGILLTY